MQQTKFQYSPKVTRPTSILPARDDYNEQMQTRKADDKVGFQIIQKMHNGNNHSSKQRIHISNQVGRYTAAQLSTLFIKKIK